MAEFAFDPKTQRFRYTSGSRAGQFVSRTNVQNLVETKIKLTKQDINTITNLLLQNKITTATWYDAMSQAIKQGQIQAYLAGKGGTYQFKSRDKGIIGKALVDEYMYLRRFAQEIEDGKLSARQIKDRASKYGDSFHKIYERGRAEAHKENGYFWERWVTSKDEKICPDCVGYGSMSWQRIGSLPGVGVATACKMRCRCYKDYSKELNKPNLSSVNSVSFLFSKSGWLK